MWDEQGRLLHFLMFLCFCCFKQQLAPSTALILLQLPTLSFLVGLDERLGNSFHSMETFLEDFLDISQIIGAEGETVKTLVRAVLL